MSSTSDKCKEGASKSNDDDVCEVNNKLKHMNTDDYNNVSVCANCGKEGDKINNICNKCKQVRYCNAACKKKHKKKHKKECEEHIRYAAKLHDEKLFKQPPAAEDCPICFLPLPHLNTGWKYYSCCGKEICSGCAHAPVFDNQGNEVDNEKCPFCRTLSPNSVEEVIERVMKRVAAGDAVAIYRLGVYHRDGINGFPQDFTKALELLHRASNLGNTDAYCDIGHAYFNGQGVDIDEKKAAHYFELAAIKGDVYARHNLGNNEVREHNTDRALKHYMIAARGGYADSLNVIKQLYTIGHATKEDYTTALQAYQVYLSEIKSKQRDEAAAADEEFRY